MKNEDRKELEKWVRFLGFTDRDDDGIGKLVITFKIRDEEENMRRIFSSMSHDDAKEIMAGYVDTITYPCEEYEKDWDDPDSGFACEFGWDDQHGEIWIGANFRAS